MASMSRESVSIHVMEHAFTDDCLTTLGHAVGDGRNTRLIDASRHQPVDCLVYFGVIVVIIGTRRAVVH